jgi:hypothetical protein
MTSEQATGPLTPRFRLHRAEDWPPELHAATTRYEAASDAVVSARAADEYATALADLNAADDARRSLMLALDKKRRPQFYSVSANAS